MEITESTDEAMTIRITRREAVAINNALNEICNGIHIHESEFRTRMGVRRDEAKELPRTINDAL